jgi:hypothetical protein
MNSSQGARRSSARLFLGGEVAFRCVRDSLFYQPTEEAGRGNSTSASRRRTTSFSAMYGTPGVRRGHAHLRSPPREADDCHGQPTTTATTRRRRSLKRQFVNGESAPRPSAGRIHRTRRVRRGRSHRAWRRLTRASPESARPEQAASAQPGTDATSRAKAAVSLANV